MPFWRCPHCGTPQPEAARCWVCRRSSTACGTCRHYRRAVVGQLGYCALDRRRSPIDGSEIRACWTAPAPRPVAAHAGQSPSREPSGVPAVATTATPGTRHASPAGRSWMEIQVGDEPGGNAARVTSRQPDDPSVSGHGLPLIDPPPIGLWGDPEV